MAFILSKESSYSRTVKFERPVDGDEETGFEEQAIHVRFREMGAAWVNATVDKINAGEVTDSDICREVIAGFDALDEQGSALPFTAENLELLLDKRHFASAAVGEFFSSLAGRKAKNSLTPQDTGSEPVG
jgi:hypothetical protein